MRNNSLKFTVLFCAVAYLVHLTQRSPLPLESILITLFSVLLPLLAGGFGFLWINKSFATGERLIKVGFGSLVISCVSIALEYNRINFLSWSYFHQPELAAWTFRAAFELLRILIPAILFMAILKYALFRIKLFPVKRTIMILGIFSFFAVLFSFLTEICMVRTIPSSIVGDFGRKIGSNFLWIFEELTPLLFPGLILSLCLTADRQVNLSESDK